MNPFPIIVPVIAATLAMALGLCGWQLLKANQRIGALQQAMDTCTIRLKDLNNAHKERDKVDGQNRALPDDALFDGLLK